MISTEMCVGSGNPWPIRLKAAVCDSKKSVKSPPQEWERFRPKASSVSVHAAMRSSSVDVEER